MPELPDDIGDRIRRIIEKAIADIEALGADHANACALVSLQSLYRLDADLEAELAMVAKIRSEATLIWDAYTTSDGETIN